jgi:uncharacterized protein (TIGR00255 family)
MNPESMTGHGRGEAASGGWSCTVECASVNRKGIEVVVSLPKPCPELETSLRERVQKSFSRGRITLSVTLEGTNRHGEDEMLDSEMARRAFQELTKLRENLGLVGEISLDLILRTPGVLKSSPQIQPSPLLQKDLVEKATDLALGRLSAMRRREGKHLAADLLLRLKTLETAVRAVRRRLPALLVQRRDSLRTRLADIGCEIPAADPALARELALMAEKSDVTEEITRLASHFAQFRAALAGEDPSGRTLDYLAQEMFREITTLGNKAGDPEISQRVVQSKAELDRIREQVANLE